MEAADKKVAPENCSICCICQKPIYPGQFVGKTTDGRLVHAGYHNTLEAENEFCETGTIGIGFWDGSTLSDERPSLAEIVMNTGKGAIREIGPEDMRN